MLVDIKYIPEFFPNFFFFYISPTQSKMHKTT